MFAKLVQSGGINAISRRLGATPAATITAARALMPGLLQGLRNFPGGFPALLEQFSEAGGVTLAAAIMGSEPLDTSPGEVIIARIGGIVLPGEGDGPEEAALRLRVAPLLAMLIIGYLSARAAAADVTESDLAALLVDVDPNPLAPDEDAV